MDVIVEFLLQQEPRLEMVINKVGELNLNDLYKPPFVALISAIIGKHISRKQAKILRSKLYIRCGGLNFTAQIILNIDLNNLGISNNLKQLIITVAQIVVDERLDLFQSKDWSRIVDIPGIEPSIITIAQLTCFANWDLFPYTDVFTKQRLQRLYQLPNLPNEKRTLELTAKFSPYRTIVTWYLWKWI